ncbi:MAG: polysaccharide deacetylase family protein [Nitrospirae bacterium]|nr:polysaccharide deacetylase family protein [Nitrospirota bacterium]
MSGVFQWPGTLARVTRNILFNLLDPPVLVLTYHRVTTLHSDSQSPAVTPQHFREQLRFLKKRFPLVRFEDAWSNIKKPAVSITFDDGYADNVLEALPVLEEMGVPATFFVCTGTIGAEKEFWWDELERIVLGDWTFPGRFELHDSTFGKTWPTGSAAERHALYEALLLLMKEVDALKREHWFVQLRQWAPAGEEWREFNRPMTAEELLRLGRSKWAEVGAHTITHTPLSSLSGEEQWKEIEGSKKCLEYFLGRNITVFSYPFGERCDYTQETVALCKKAGFTKVAANFPGQTHRWTDFFQIPRLVVRNWPAEVFVKQMKRFWIV